ncbi:MAG: sulfotransferase [Bryobacteraceae bacterium]
MRPQLPPNPSVASLVRGQCDTVHPGNTGIAVFILLGYPRSGNTLLGAVLNANDWIVIPDETDFILPVCMVCQRVPNAHPGRKILANLIANTERFDHSIGRYIRYAEIVRALSQCEYSASAVVIAIHELVSRNAGKLIAGNRSPNDIAYVPDMAKAGLFDSDIKVVHLVRDPRDVYVSTRRLNWIPPEQLQSELPGTWTATNLMLARLLRNNLEQYLCVRYEDLISDPKRQIQRITDFLGVPFQPKMLEARTRSGLYEDQPHHANVGLEFLPSRIAAFRRELSPGIADEIAERASEGMNFFGYAKVVQTAFPKVRSAQC